MEKTADSVGKTNRSSYTAILKKYKKLSKIIVGLINRLIIPKFHNKVTSQRFANKIGIVSGPARH